MLTYPHCPFSPHPLLPVRQARKPPAAAAPPAKKPPAPATSSAAKGKAPATANTSEPLKFKFSSEDAEARWQEAIPADLQAELADGNWKLRLEGAEKMTAWLAEGHASDVEAEVFFRFFAKVPGWSEKNFQVRRRSSLSRWRAGRPLTRCSTAITLPLAGLVQDLRHDGPPGGQVADLFQGVHRHRHRPPDREARRHQAQEAGRRRPHRLCREDVAVVRARAGCAASLPLSRSRYRG